MSFTSWPSHRPLYLISLDHVSVYADSHPTSAVPQRLFSSLSLLLPPFSGLWFYPGFISLDISIPADEPPSWFGPPGKVSHPHPPARLVFAICWSIQCLLWPFLSLWCTIWRFRLPPSACRPRGPDNYWHCHAPEHFVAIILYFLRTWIYRSPLRLYHRNSQTHSWRMGNRLG